MRTFEYYLLAINILSLILYGADKAKARRRAWRIPEAILLLAAAAGGSIGALAGMFLFRHKTRHWKFIIGVPLILLIQIILLVTVVG